jgi:hypothetical protein
MEATKTFKTLSILFQEDKLIFNDNAKFQHYIKIAAVVCWLAFSFINAGRLLNNFSTMYLMMSVIALAASLAMGYSLIKETTQHTVHLKDITNVLIKNLPTNKLHGRVRTKNKKFRHFSIPKEEINQQDFVAYFKSKGIEVIEE